jgi:GH15 family glucan-1,4-alpha-glucosidase
MNTNRGTLYQHSLRVILDNQHASGAYIACPNMPDYQYSWFRDGAYIAYALTLDGEAVSAFYKGSMAAQWESASRFHDWCAGVVNDRQVAIQRSIDRVNRGQALDMQDVLHARYLPDGKEGPDGWPEFQLDGPGTWLWALEQYIRRARITPLPVAWERAIRLTARYLEALWQNPCYDCWEERGDDVHISTLGAIFAGLSAAQKLVPVLNFTDTLRAIKDYVLEKGLTPGGELAKSVGLDRVDANLLSVAVPHGMLAVDDPIMQRTKGRIERELHAPGSGVHRHLEDTYYGGGAWVLLALHLAWYDIEAGAPEAACALVDWVEQQADADGELPEQVNTPMLDAYFYDPWVKERGPIARPLLWTHANYLLVLRTGGLLNDTP